jgi:hypothetical protein
MREKAGLVRYLAEAFAFRWNLLLFGGASVAAVLSGHPDIAMPLVAAAEVTYLAGLASTPRFQAAIDAKAHKVQIAAPPSAADKAAEQVNARERIMEVLKSLSDERRARFLRLRARCVEMQRIANAVRGETTDASGAVAELRAPQLDRLLWVFLKLLLSDQAIARFLKAADQVQIQASLAELEERVAKRTAAVPEADRESDRILRSLHDSVATAQARKENVEKSQANAEFVAAELDRLESKIAALTEMSVGHADADEMSSKIDAIAEGMSQTEATIRELQQITGMSADHDTPSILGADFSSHPAPQKVKQR